MSDSASHKTMASIMVAEELKLQIPKQSPTHGKDHRATHRLGRLM